MCLGFCSRARCATSRIATVKQHFNGWRDTGRRLYAPGQLHQCGTRRHAVLVPLLRAGYGKPQVPCSAPQGLYRSGFHEKLQDPETRTPVAIAHAILSPARKQVMKRVRQQSMVAYDGVCQHR